jgi:hypothetical protein
MRRMFWLVSTTIVMVALALTSVLPAFAAPPTLYVECRTGGFVDAHITDIPQTYKAANALYRDCVIKGSRATRDITPNPGKPTR